jgi:DNA-binding XRE family transcriptional regulator
MSFTPVDGRDKAVVESVEGLLPMVFLIGCSFVGLLQILDVMWNEDKALRLGKALKELRAEKGLSQEVLAFHAGLTKNQIQLIEAGRGTGRSEGNSPSNPRMSTLVGIAAVFELSVAELLSKAGL